MRRVFDVAGFAVHTVLGVDLQAVGVVFVFDKLVYAGWAIAGLRAGKLGQIDIRGHAGVFERQVGWLVFFVVGVGHEHTG